MKKWFRRVSTTFLVVCLAFSTAYAKKADVSVMVESPAEAELGTSFSAALMYEGAEFGTASVEINYDDELLEYRSCSGGQAFADDGVVHISLDGGGGKVYLSCKVRFKAVGEGESFLTVTTASLTDSDGKNLSAQTDSVKVRVVEASAAADVDGSDGTASSDGVTSAGGESNADGSGGATSSDGAASADDAGGLAGILSKAEDVYAVQAVKEASLRVVDGFAEMFRQFSVTEFLLFSMCMTVILLLLILLAAEKRR